MSKGRRALRCRWRCRILPSCIVQMRIWSERAYRRKPGGNTSLQARPAARNCRGATSSTIDLIYVTLPVLDREKTWVATIVMGFGEAQAEILLQTDSSPETHNSY